MMIEKLIFEYGEKITSMLHEIADFLKETNPDNVRKSAAGRMWCKKCIHREMCKWYGTNGCPHIEENGWIDDKYPPANGQYLTLFEDGNVDTNLYSFKDQGWSIFDDAVVAWRPIPEINDELLEGD